MVERELASRGHPRKLSAGDLQRSGGQVIGRQLYVLSSQAPRQGIGVKLADQQQQQPLQLLGSVPNEFGGRSIFPDEIHGNTGKESEEWTLRSLMIKRGGNADIGHHAHRGDQQKP